MTPSSCALFLVLSLTGEPQDGWRVLDFNDGRCPPGARCVWAGELTVDVIDTRSTMPPIRIQVDNMNKPGPWFAKSLDRNRIQVCKMKPSPTNGKS